ncbi:uncharacterized protein [Aegilops tauschii subsp. strangulata]|uniref:Uncharacterized protein n=1 Tax=Aegilops tauschii subsp. strangulata TaxID=200361 RepID=A0A453IT00_AEGTS|nr:uncharacterized protein LOC109779075 isoform X3 [Aegilops tauschii subsp. strangulata]
MPPEKAAAASSGGVPTTHLGKEAAAGAASSGEIPQKKATPSSGGSAGSGALHGNSTSQYSEESAAGHPSKKARTASSLKIPQKHHKADISLSGGTLQKQSSEVEADTSSSGEVLHEQEHPKHFQESDPNEIVHAKEENKHVQEANHLIEQLNELGGMGEDISEEEFLAYHDKLPRIPCYIVARKLTNEELDEQDLRHALCRFRYYKYKLKEEGKEDTFDLKDVSEAECDQAFLKKQRFFRRFEEISTLDWYFHPDYCKDPSLSDYQRLVLRNYGSSEYARWTEYHEFLHSHDVEEEYVKFCEELFKKLEWMEGYLDFPRPSHKWDRISSRGALQAIKLASTTFQKITASLAYYGYFECKQSMAYDRTWYKDLDGVHFEIWCRVTEKQMSFRDALAEVCKLNRFPLRQRRLEGALKRDYTMERLESEYHTCTAKVPPGTEKDKAKELIAKAVKNRLNKPKTYAQYISKKIHIARVAGILPLKDSKEQCS